MIDKLIRQELAAAVRKNGLHHSKHEAYAILKEEVEEAEDEMKEILQISDALWFSIRKDWDELHDRHLQKLEKATNRAIKELIQVAAMVEKFKLYERMCQDGGEESEKGPEKSTGEKESTRENVKKGFNRQG